MLLEAECHQLDRTMTIERGSSFDRYKSTMEELIRKRDEQQTLKDELKVLQQLLTLTLATVGIPTAGTTPHPLVLQIVSEIQATQKKIQDVVSTKLMSMLCDCTHA